MTNEADHSAPNRWIVQGPDVSSGTLLEHVNADSSAHVIKRIAHDAVVLSMTVARAQQLKVDFVRNLIEVDADVSLFGEP